MSEILQSVGGDVYEIRCVVCGETFMMSIGDEMQVLIRANDGSDFVDNLDDPETHETSPIHDSCGGTTGAERWLKTGKAYWE